MRVVATRAIAAGEELTVAYKAAGLHRPDASLFLYGFLPALAVPPGEAEAEQPLLCAVDLPTYRRGNPWRRTDTTDERYGGWVDGGAGCRWTVYAAEGWGLLFSMMCIAPHHHAPSLQQLLMRPLVGLLFGARSPVHSRHLAF